MLNYTYMFTKYFSHCVMNDVSTFYLDGGGGVLSNHAKKLGVFVRGVLSEGVLSEGFDVSKTKIVACFIHFSCTCFCKFELIMNRETQIY